VGKKQNQFFKTVHPSVEKKQPWARVISREFEADAGGKRELEEANGSFRPY
jgi:hypothetical protein